MAETTQSKGVVRPLSKARPKSIQLGGFSPSLTEQGFREILASTDVEHFEKDDIAISRLFTRGMLTYTQHVQAREKLAKKIRTAVDSADLKAGRQ